MILTKLKPPKISENSLSVFGGLDKTSSIEENCFEDTQNTTAEHFPLLSTRQKRISLCTFDERPSALHTVNGITITIKNNLFHNGVLQFDGLSDTDKKQIISMGSMVIVFPDGYYINTLTKDVDGVCSDKGFLGQKAKYDLQVVSLIPCLIDKIPDTSEKRPIYAEDESLWLDTSVVPNVLMQFSMIDRTWTPIESTHYCIKADNVNYGFSVGDNIEISGFRDELDGQNTIINTGENYVIVRGTINNIYTVITTPDHPITVERVLPVMDFVCQHQNRLFGCRYGKNNKGEFVNEIYASKLGDPKNWNSFYGLSTDSYVASCGSDGAWTGIVSHMGYVVFFKEKCIHRLFGTKPSNFNLYQDEYPGVKNGSEKSLCLMNGTLLYHSENGIFAYTGSAPFCVSEAFGDEKFSNASAAILKNIYYISMLDKSGEKQLFTFDTEKNIWHREDSTDYSLLSYLDGNIIGVKENGGSFGLDLLRSDKIPQSCQSLFSQTLSIEDDFEWFAQSGKLSLSVDNRKYLKKLKIRFETEAESTVSIFLQLDSSGIWEQYGSFSTEKLTPFVLEIVPKRCDHFNIRICGNGECKIYSLTKVIEHASEVF